MRRVSWFVIVGNGCKLCKDGYFKDERESECQRCPLHTRPSEDKTKCILYTAYDFDNEYSLYMRSFDSTRNRSDKSPTHDHDKSFFGPFTNGTCLL